MKRWRDERMDEEAVEVVREQVCVCACACV